MKVAERGWSRRPEVVQFLHSLPAPVVASATPGARDNYRNNLLKQPDVVIFIVCGKILNNAE